MMKGSCIKLFIIVLFCGAFFNCDAQSVKKVITRGDTTWYIKAKHYQGVIFPASYSNDIREKGRFTPGKEEINEAETALSQIWNKVNVAQKNIKSKLTNVTPYFSNYMRQYYGYSEEHGQRVIYIHLLNFSDKPLAAKYFMGWGSRYMAGSDAFYEQNTAGFSYNLVTKVIVEN